MSWLEAMAELSCDLLQHLQRSNYCTNTPPALEMSSVVEIFRDIHGCKINAGFSNKPPSPA